MYYTGLDPRTMKPVYVPTDPHEKAMQRALIQYRNPKNYFLVHEALTKAGRTDLIGFDKHCLIRPKQGEKVRKAEKPAAKPLKSAKKSQKPQKQQKLTKKPLPKQPSPLLMAQADRYLKKRKKK